MTTTPEPITLTRKGKQSQRDEMTARMLAEARDQLGNVDLVEDWNGEHGGRADWPHDDDLTLSLDYRRLGTTPARKGATVVPAVNWAGDEADDESED